MRTVIQILCLLTLASCHSKSINSNQATQSVQPERANFSFKSERGPSAENSQKGPVCDLSQDRCSGKPLTEEQNLKTYFLSDLVQQELENIETKEKKNGHDFKVAIIGRMGSNLSKFQPLRDTNKFGQPVTLNEMVDELVAQSKEVRKSKMSALQNNPYAKDSNNNLEPLLVQGWFDRTRKLKYSHLGIALKNLPLKNEKGELISGKGTGKWSVVQLLYSCEEGKKSHLYKGTTGYFFADHMYDYGAQIMVPTQSLQNNIEKIVSTNYAGKNWLESHYNALALSTDLDQQNSNQWVLEVIAAAIAGESVKGRSDAQSYLKQTNFKSTLVTPTGLYSAIQIPFVAKMISSIMPTVCMTHQESIKKYGIGEIVSALSVEEYLKNNKQLISAVEVELTAEDKEVIASTQNYKQKVNIKHLIKGQ